MENVQRIGELVKYFKLFYTILSSPKCRGQSAWGARLYNLRSQASTFPLPLTSIVPRGSKTNWPLSRS